MSETNAGISQRGPYRKVYHHVCEACGHRFMSARPDTKYCPGRSAVGGLVPGDSACKQRAKRKRQRDRERQAFEAREAKRQAAEQAERQARDRADAAKVRQADEQRRQREAEQEATRRQQAAAKERQREAVIRQQIGDCPTCGKSHYFIMVKSELFGLKKTLHMTCAHDGTEVPVTVRPGPCRCGMPVSSHYWYELLGNGDLRCKLCGQVRRWGQYPVDSTWLEFPQ